MQRYVKPKYEPKKSEKNAKRMQINEELANRGAAEPPQAASGRAKVGRLPGLAGAEPRGRVGRAERVQAERRPTEDLRRQLVQNRRRKRERRPKAQTRLSRGQTRRARNFATQPAAEPRGERGAGRTRTAAERPKALLNIMRIMRGASRATHNSASHYVE